MDSPNRKLVLRRLSPAPPKEQGTGFLFQTDYLFNGKTLLCGIIGWSEAQLDEVIALQNSYTMHRKRKRDGSYRRLDVPHPKLMEFQYRYLHYFLYRMLGRGWLDARIKGFIPGTSHIKNAKFHARPETHFTVRLDLEDAFPSVKAEYVREALARVLEAELKCYENVEASRGSDSLEPVESYPDPPLFSWYKAKWFRKAFKANTRYSRLDTRAIVREFLDLSLPLITYRGTLPQGARTSPFLLNLALSHYGVPELIYHWFRERGQDVRMTLYADDFTISSSTPIAREAIEGVLVEWDGRFRFNRQKVCYFDRRQIAPLVTGLRIVKRGNVDTVSIPKRKLRMIRGLIHRAETEPELRLKVKGYINYLNGVYGPKLPNQVRVPYEHLMLISGQYLTSKGRR